MAAYGLNFRSAFSSVLQSEGMLHSILRFWSIFGRVYSAAAGANKWSALSDRCKAKKCFEGLSRSTTALFVTTIG